MKAKTSAFKAWPSLFPEKVKLIKTGQVCENRGYYGNLFTIRFPDGSMAEVHRRELEMDWAKGLKRVLPRQLRPRTV